MGNEHTSAIYTITDNASAIVFTGNNGDTIRVPYVGVSFYRNGTTNVSIRSFAREVIDLYYGDIVPTAGSFDGPQAVIDYMNNIVNQQYGGATSSATTALLTDMYIPYWDAASGVFQNSWFKNGASGVTILSNKNLSFGNTTNAFLASFRAGVTVNNIDYVLPITDPTAGQVLSSSVPVAGVATLSWINAVTPPINPSSGYLPYNNSGAWADSYLSQNGSSLLIDYTKTIVASNGSTKITTLNFNVAGPNAGMLMSFNDGTNTSYLRLKTGGKWSLNGLNGAITSDSTSLNIVHDSYVAFNAPFTQMGVSAAVDGVLKFANITNSFKATIQTGVTSADYTWTLPLAQGTAGQVLSNDGAGVLSWVDNTAGSVTSVSGTANRITSTGGATPVIDISAAYVGQSSITTLGTLTGGATGAGFTVALTTSTITGTLTVSNGGTGIATTTAYGTITGGTTATGVFQNAGTGTSGQVLTSAGNAALPTWATPTTGTVTSVSVVTTQGVSGSVATATTTPAITLTLGALTGVTSFNGLVITANTGTITTGVWNGTTIAIANGGTGQTTANAGFNALSPMTTGGDLIYGGASGAGTRLANGTAGQILQSNGTTLAPTWVTLSSGITIGTTVITSGTTTRILYDNAGVVGEYTITGTGTVVAMATSPSFTTPALGTPSAGVLTSCTGLPLTTGVTGALPIANGGTANTTAGAAFNALSPMTTGGDLIYGGASGAGTRLANGTAGQFLMSNGTTVAPSWSSVSGTISGLTATRIPIAASASTLTDSANFIWTTTDNVLKIGTAAHPIFIWEGKASVDTNTGIGYQTLNAVTTGSNQTAVGYQTLAASTTNGSNTGVGYQVLQVVTTGAQNTGMGRRAINNGNGDNCSAFGYNSQANVTTGNYNTTFGSNTLPLHTTGSNNTVMGGNAMGSHTSGANNTAFGFQSLYTNVSGANNLALGYLAGYYSTGSSEFYLSSFDATNTAGDKSKSLMYGVMTSTTANQTLQINAKAYIGVAATDAVAPTALIHLAAGTATANTAPLQLTTGTVETVARAGVMEYTTPQLFFTNGGAQRQEIPQIQQTRVSTQFDKTTSTTMGAITGLTATLVAGKIYTFEVTLFVTADVVGGSKYDLSGTATATTVIYSAILVDNTSNANSITTTTTALATSIGQAGTTSGVMKIKGLIVVNGAGTLTPRFAQNASNGTSSVLSGSSFVTQEIL